MKSYQECIIASDILIPREGDTIQEAIKRLWPDAGSSASTMQKQLKIDKAKFKLRMTEVAYVGHMLLNDGLKADLLKIEAIQRMCRPTDVKCVQHLAGLVNYLPRF